MKEHLNNRAQEEAKYLIKTQKTIREVAKYFHLSKSTVHKDLQERLEKISPFLFNQVRPILITHIKTRHIKGGESTKLKYLQKQESE